MADETNPKSLYVGNLDATVAEDFLEMLFQQFGEVKGCKMVREHGSDPYAFIEFANHSSAVTALMAMNKRLLQGKEMKVNWASSPANQPKVDTSQHHHIFVGDLSPEIDTQLLREAFAPFGEISNCRIVRDTVTLKPKGYAFISFVNHADAEAAIKSMNGQWLGSRTIKTNWSTRTPTSKPNNNNSGVPAKRAKQHTYEEIFNESSPTNSTVYCGGFGANGLTEQMIESAFSKFGEIADIKLFSPKGFAFIRFSRKEDAAHAIEEMDNDYIEGSRVKCHWGKEPSEREAHNANRQQNQSQENNSVDANQYNNYNMAQQWYSPEYAAAYMPGFYYQQMAAAYMPPGAMGYRMPAGVQRAMAPQGWVSTPGGAQVAMPVPTEAAPPAYSNYPIPEASATRQNYM